MATTYFTVSGSGMFPFDMLRYDMAYPVAVMNDFTGDGYRTIELATAGKPTVARWASFG